MFFAVVCAILGFIPGVYVGIMVARRLAEWRK